MTDLTPYDIDAAQAFCDAGVRQVGHVAFASRAGNPNKGWPGALRAIRERDAVIAEIEKQNNDFAEEIDYIRRDLDCYKADVERRDKRIAELEAALRKFGSHYNKRPGDRCAIIASQLDPANRSTFSEKKRAELAAVKCTCGLDDALKGSTDDHTV